LWPVVVMANDDNDNDNDGLGGASHISDAEKSFIFLYFLTLPSFLCVVVSYRNYNIGQFCTVARL
jgi:hypothetical protein